MKLMKPLDFYPGRRKSIIVLVGRPANDIRKTSQAMEFMIINSVFRLITLRTGGFFIPGE
jgi:hypothetical protein